MYLKKLIGAFTALIMTVTVFAGSAVTVSAYSETQTDGSYKLNITCGTDPNSEQWTGYADITEFNKFLGSSGYTFTHDDKMYIVTNGTVDFEGISLVANVTVSEAVTLNIPDDIDGATVNVTSNTVGSYMNGDYVTAKGATVSIIIMPPSGQQITDVKINDKSQPRDNDTSWQGTHIMDDNATLSVTFAGTHSITVNPSEHGTVNVPQTTAKAGDDVTVYIDPEEGYELANLSVTYGENQSVNVEGSGNTRTFKMPEDEVTVTATFEETVVLPGDVLATFQGNYTEDQGVDASLWEGTLMGNGFAYKPFVSVTLRSDGSNEPETRTAICNTVVTDGDITIAVVVDKVRDQIEEVRLRGLEAETDQTADGAFNATVNSQETEVD